jgi:hypothetical protein
MIPDRSSSEMATAIRRRKGFQEGILVLCIAFSLVFTVISVKRVLLDRKAGIVTAPSETTSTLVVFGITMVVAWAPSLIGFLLSYRLNRLLSNGRMVPAVQKGESFSYEFDGKPYLVQDSRAASESDRMPVACVDPGAPQRAVILMVSRGPLAEGAGMLRRFAGLFRRRR